MLPGVLDGVRMTACQGYQGRQSSEVGESPLLDHSYKFSCGWHRLHTCDRCLCFLVTHPSARIIDTSLVTAIVIVGFPFSPSAYSRVLLFSTTVQ